MLLAVTGDVAAFVATAALRKWAREIYIVAAGGGPGEARSFSLEQLRGYWMCASQRPAKNWSEARSPIDSAWLEAKRLAWIFEGPFAVITDRGVKLQLCRRCRS